MTKKKENKYLEQFKDIYELATEIKMEQKKVTEHTEKLIERMENLEIQQFLLTEMESLVEEETQTKNVMGDLKTLYSRVNLTEEEEALLSQDKHVLPSQEPRTLQIFEKILNKIEIFEAFKEISTMNESSGFVNDVGNLDPSHISNVIATGEGSESGVVSQNTSSGYFSSLWKISGFFGGERVEAYFINLGF
jgi:hypothetical protein